MSKLLDYTGLGRFLDKLKTLFVTDVGVNGNSLTCTKDGVTSNITVPYANVGGGVLFGTVDVNSPNVAMTATVPGLTELKDGVVVYIVNDIVGASSGSWTLNVNNLGAKPVHNSKTLTKIASSDFAKNKAFLLIYNSTLVSGGCWIFYIGDYSDSDSTAYIMRTTGEYFVTKETLYPRVLCFTYSDTEILPSARERSTADNKELTTLDFNPFGRIYYYSITSVINQGDSIGGVYLYYQINIDFRYAFNTGSTLVDAKAVYLKCQPLTNNEGKRTGRVKFAEGQPIVQTLPNTEDGFVYIFLGTATSEKNIQFALYHPIYEFKNGALRLWTNSEDFSGKADKDTQATQGNIAVFNSNGNPVDGGKSIQSMGNGILYGTIDKTLSSTNNLVVNVDGLSELTPGTTIYIQNKEVYPSSTCTMNVNNLGALPIYETDNSLVRVGFTNGTAFMFIYNPTRVEGGCWDKQSGKFQYFNLGYFSRSIAAQLIAKADFTGPTITVHYSTTELLPLFTNKIATTLDFDPFSNIYWWYYGSCSQGDVVTPTSLYTRYEFTSFTLDSYPLTKNKQFFLRCEPITVNGIRNGRVRLASEPFTQDLPNTEDGFVYILIGLRNNGTTGGWLSHIHPIYEYKAGALRLWTNQEEHLALTSEEIDRDIIEIVEWEDPVFKQWVLGNSSFGVNNNIIIPGEVLQSQLDAVTSYAGGSNNYSVSKGDDLAKFTNMTNMGSNMFTAQSQMTSVLLPSKLQTIGIGSFSGCSSLQEIILPNTLSYIDYGAFRYCTSLQTITIPDNVYYLGSEAFNGCTNLKTAVIGNGVRMLNGYTFYMCTSLESIVIGNSVTSIGQNDLARCSSLTSVTFGNSLTSIGSDAFWECTALKTLEFPDSLTNITSGAFSGCNLEVVDFGNTRSSIVPYVYFGQNTTIIVPDSLVEDWKATSDWSSIASQIVSYSEYHNSN